MNLESTASAWTSFKKSQLQAEEEKRKVPKLTFVIGSLERSDLSIIWGDKGIVKGLLSTICSDPEEIMQ